MTTTPSHQGGERLATITQEQAVWRTEEQRLGAIIATQRDVALAGLDVDTVMSLIVARAQTLTGAAGAVVELAEGDEMVYHAVSGTAGPHLGLRLTSVGSLSGRCVATGEILTCDDTETDPRVDRAACRRIGARSMIVVPLHHAQTIVGVLKVLAPNPRAFSTTDVQTLQLMVGVLAAALGHAREFAAKQALIEELRTTKAAAEAADRAKSAFLANMSHELRTPLNAIIGFSEVLQDETFGALNARQQRYVSNVLESGRHLLGLINDVLDLSKVEAGRMELHREELPVLPLLAEVRDQMLPLAEKKGVDLRLAAGGAAGPVLHADRARVVQILYNLLSNAIKFTPSGGAVTLTAAPTSQTVILAVADTGIGIAPEDQARIFEEFQQVDSSVGRTQQGTGLGLALTRRLVELHGGTLSVVSAPGQGSTFTVTLPGAPEAPVAVAPVAAPRGTVLVVEDDRLAYELLSVYVREAGYEVQWVQRVADVAPRARALRPVAITLDLQLGDETGWSALEQLRADPQTRDIPVVIISILDEQAPGFALGASAYLTKPVARPELLSTLTRVIDGDPATPGGRRVLAVDDQLEALELISLALEGSQYQVLRATSGAEALALLAHERPDVLLVDLEMAPLSGFDVIEAVVASPRTREIPIIVLTARDLRAADMARLNGHVAATLAKSGFDKDRFLRELRRATQSADPGGAADAS